MSYFWNISFYGIDMLVFFIFLYCMYMFKFYFVFYEYIYSYKILIYNRFFKFNLKYVINGLLIYIF